MGSRLRAPAQPLIALALVSVAAVPSAADPRPAAGPTAVDADQARRRFEAAMAAFERKEYEPAIADFEAAYRLDPRPEVLFALAQAERLSGDCPTAIALYRRFLATEPAEKHAAVARAGLERCEAALASRPLDPPAPAEGDAGPEPEPELVARRAAPVVVARGPSRAWYEDPLGDALLVAGLGGLGFGGWAYASSLAAVEDADAATTYEAYGAAMDRAAARRRWAWAGIGGGAALAATAVVRYAVAGDDEPATTAAVSVDGEAVSVLAVGRF